MKESWLIDDIKSINRLFETFIWMKNTKKNFQYMINEKYSEKKSFIYLMTRKNNWFYHTYKIDIHTSYSILYIIWS